MNLEKFIISLLLFLFSVFLFPELESGIGGISPSETLLPVFRMLPVIWVGALLFSMAYWGFSSND